MKHTINLEPIIIRAIRWNLIFLTRKKKGERWSIGKI